MSKIVTNVSFSDALKFLKEFRYKKRKDWSKDERIFFKICNFVVLSKKRINKIFEAFKALEKLSNKSHYRYTENDINLVKGLILENLEVRLKSFNKRLSIYKDADIELFQSHLGKLKDENTRLENENRRLQFIIENFVKENELFEIENIQNLVIEKKENIGKTRTSLKKNRITFSKTNIKKFLKLWNEGKTSIEIAEMFSKKAYEKNINRKKI